MQEHFKYFKKANLMTLPAGPSMSNGFFKNIGKWMDMTITSSEI